ncbi:MAG: hypothetical protein ACYCX7_11835 [Solirubrobacteraceae bacterium]
MGRRVGSRARTAALAATIATALGAPPAAQASLVYVRKPSHPVVYIARDSGASARRLVAGADPRISPDGASVVYLRVRNARTYTQEMMVVPATGGKPRKLAGDWRDPYVFAFSPDSSEVAAVLGPEVGADTLVLIDLATGRRQTLARGYFSGVSFSPAEGALVYGRARSESYPAQSNVYRVSSSGGAPVALTGDDRSLSPLWSPTGEVAFVKQLEAGTRQYGPKNELYLMSSSGGTARRLTHTKVGPLLQGLTPTQFSENGSELLAEFGGQDTSYAVTVNPRTGAQARPLSGVAGYGFIGTALSADGSTILGTAGGFYPSRKHDVVTVPYAGGPASILARDAYEPDWNR